MSPPCLRRSFLAVSLLFALLVTGHAATLIPRGVPWNYFKGTTEPSNPIGAWRAVAFNDASWSNGLAPFRYGDGTGGTLLADMRGNYTTLYLRRAFNVSEAALISRLNLVVNYDDGFMVWINGNPVLSENAPGTPTHDSTADTEHESGSFETIELADPQSFLVDGENTIAIQVFNDDLESSDFLINPELISTAPDAEPPVVAGFDPPPGNVVDLSQITVTFSEPVTGVEASDLTINGVEAESVSGSGDEYNFAFSEVPAGQVTVAWSVDHGITDTATPPNPFDSTSPDDVKIYEVADEIAPSIAETVPLPDLTLRGLREISVRFSEPVAGLEAGDLLFNGSAATSVVGTAAGPYLFTYPGAGVGPLTISWAADHGITDLAPEPNPFLPNEWEYTIDPTGELGDVLINEFNAANRSGWVDEDDEETDWIELWNFGDTPIELDGWSLSDDADNPGKFVLPARTLAPGSYLVIAASGKDRAPDDSGEIHTNFKLAASGEFLGLFPPELPRVAADQLEPEFPQQRNDFSYGRNPNGEWRYYRNPSPGGRNGNSTTSGLLAPPHVNAERGFYSQPFELQLTTDMAGATIYYTTDGSEPTLRNGEAYLRPIRISRTVVFRAATFKDGYLPSEVITHTYLYNVSPAIQSLPVVSLVTDDSNLWGPTGIQEFNPRNTVHRGIAWERPVSAELIRPEDNSGLQVNCGLRVQGGDSIRRRYNPNERLPYSKYSFRLYFRGDYGPTTLKFPWFEGSEVQEFDRIVLRAGMNDHSNPFIVDEMVRRMQIDTGHVGSRGNYVNLFVNGQHKGYYNSTERIDDDFLRSWHGGDNEWDVIAQFGEVREGDTVAWNLMRSIVKRDLRIPSNYLAALDVLDVENFIDYLLVNVYASTDDWPHNNWRAARERVRGRDAKFRFYVWDAERALGNLNRSPFNNTLTTELAIGSEIAQLYQSLVESPEFRLHWADRVQKHFYNGGALEDDNIELSYRLMRGELARVLPNMYTTITSSWIPNRRPTIMQHMEQADLHRSDAAPLFTPQHGGPVDDDFELTIRASGGLTIYYTLDGSDPRRALTRENLSAVRTLVPENAAKRVLVPSPENEGDSLGLAWTGRDEPFDDSHWTAAEGGVGFDDSNEFAPFIDLDLGASMKDQNSSCYLRIPFTLTEADLEDVGLLTLSLRYDDGFVAYLNGERVAHANAGATMHWNSAATDSHADNAAVNLLSFNVTDHLDELVVGDNILSIHALNEDPNGADFLLSAKLQTRGDLTGKASETAREYEQPIPLAGTVTVKARSLDEGEWSALTEAEFFGSPDAPAIRITEIMYNPDGSRELEFLELQNVGDRPVDLGHMHFDGINFTFRPGTMLAPGERIVLISNDDPDAFASEYPDVDIFGTFGGNLSNGGENLALLEGLGRTIISVDYDDSNGWPTEPYGDGKSLVLIDSAGDSNDPTNWAASAQDGGSPGADEPPLSQPPVSINEVLADNRSAVPHAGSFSGMIELYNPGAAARNLTGWGLSNDGADPHKFTFPAGTQVSGRSYLVVWCDNSQAAPGLHSGFALNPAGETLFLSDPDGDRIDAFSFGLQVADHSLSRTGNLTVPTPGGANGTAVSLAAQDQLAINEWLANRIAGQSDWLELYNQDPDHPVALRDLHFDNSATIFRYAAHSFLSPKGFVRLWADEEPGPSHLGFRLPAEGTTISLIDAGGATVDTVTYSTQGENISRGRLPDGTGEFRSFPNAASPGAPNYESSNPGLKFNELLARGADPTAGWVELRNDSDAPFELNGFSMVIGDRDGDRWTFPDALTIPVDGHLVVACDPGRPAAANAGNLNTSMALPLQGGAVYLLDNAGREIDRVEFGSQVVGLSIGRITDSGNWTLLAAPTPDDLNFESSPFGSFSALRINEWLANSPSDAGDFVELYNPSDDPGDLTGLRLTDDLSTSGVGRFTFPALSFIAGGGFAVLTADDSPAPGHLPFRLHADGESLRLYRATGTQIIDEVTWGREEEGVSSGRLPDGDETIEPLFFLSPGTSNSADPNADQDGDGIADHWEDSNGLDPSDPDDALLDPDQDRRNNLFEFLSNTDPNDPASFLAIESLLLDVTELTLHFTAQPGVRYTAQFSEDLIDWQFLATIEAAPSARPATARDPAVTPGRYYRLVAQRP